MPEAWPGFERYRSLASAYGPPGLEGPVRQRLRGLLSPCVRKLETDRIGNLYAFLGPSEAPLVMIGAHMDEVALVVSGVTDSGLLRVLPQGWLKPESYAEQPVVVLTQGGLVPGIAHVETESLRSGMARMVIDVSAGSPIGVSQMGILPGDRACFEASISLRDAETVVGKAADDRVGIYALAEIARRLRPGDMIIQLALVGTVQEEAIDTFAAWAGAAVAGRRLAPVLMLGIDTAEARGPDGESVDADRGNLAGGFGLLRGAQDLHPGLVEHLRLRAESAQVEHQIVPVSATAADYTRVARAADGIPCAGLAIPILGAHSAQEKFRWRALEDAISFLVSLLAEPGGLLEAAAATD